MTTSKKWITPVLIALCWAAAWAVTLKFPSLWPVALLGFAQNIAFTFVSRGRNSGSLGYHFISAIFSNGMYAALLFFTVDTISQAKTMPVPFLAVYTLTTLSGSMFAHWLALRLEKGKARGVQEDKFAKLEARTAKLETDLVTARVKIVQDIVARLKVPHNHETVYGVQCGPAGGNVKARVWVAGVPNRNFDPQDILRLLYETNDIGMSDPARAEHLCRGLGANCVEVSSGAGEASIYSMR